MSMFESIVNSPVLATAITALKWISAIASAALLYGIIYVILRNMQNAAKAKREKEERLRQTRP